MPGPKYVRQLYDFAFEHDGLIHLIEVKKNGIPSQRVYANSLTAANLSAWLMGFTDSKTSPPIHVGRRFGSRCSGHRAAIGRSTQSSRIRRRLRFTA